LTRRKLAATALASPLLGQTVSAPPRAEEELKRARDQVRRASEALSKFPVPPETEPACHFRA